MNTYINFPAILIANISAIILMWGIIESSYRERRYTLFDWKIYYAMAIMTILQCVLEIATYVIDGQTYPAYYVLSYIFNSSLYIINIVFAFLWTVYVDYKLFEDRERIKKIYPFVAIPAVLIILGAILNFVTPVFYTISADNVYQRTGLYIIPYAVTYLYLLFGVVMVYAYRNKVRKYLFLPAIVFMIPILIGSIFQFLFYGYSLVWLGVAIAMVSLYINVQNEASYIDSLSGLFTRQYLYNYLRGQSRKNDPNRIMAGIMMDVDQFKHINDKYGHMTGDIAITTCGKILHNVVEHNGLAARYAGDEFIIIQFVKEKAQIEDTLKKIEVQTEKFNQTNKDSFQLGFSVGYTVWDCENDTVDTFLNRMDMKMYEEKKAKIARKEIPERRGIR